MILRPYQRAALDGIWSFWDKGGGSPLVVAPTGSGKSVLVATFCKEAREHFFDTRLIIATHVKELIAQNFRAMLSVWPSAPAGIYSAGLGQRSTGKPITFCGIQSVYGKAAAFGHIDLLLIDEAHLLSRRSDSMYGRFIVGLREINPHLKVIGFTATPYRLDSGRLDTGKGALFDGIAYDIGILGLVKDGFLSPLRSKATQTTFDVSGVHKRGGEFVESELQSVVDRNSTTQSAVREIVQFGADRRSWLCFCSGVAHATHVAEALGRHGISADVVSGTTPQGERDRLIAAFKAGDIRCLANANLLTTGFDHPPLDLIAMLRPTLSTGLYVQMLGRGMRIADGKENCLVLDFARNIERHGPVDMVQIGDHKEKGDGDAPVKVCPQCGEIVYTAVRVCPDCGFEFPFQSADDKIQSTASRAAVMSDEIGAGWAAVTQMLFRKHLKAGGHASLKVTYQCGISLYNEWVCFDHPAGSFPQSKAQTWWRIQRGLLPGPKSVDEALERQGELTPPSEVMVRRNGKYFEIVSRRFVRSEAA